MDTNVFVSVGSTGTEAQESFVRAIEERIRAEGMTPHTVNRNTFTAGAPLDAVAELMKTCTGAVVIALERTYFPSGIEKRGGTQEHPLSETKLPTPWNQIEAAMAYAKGLPLMVIVEKGIKEEGLLDRGYNWYVQSVVPAPASLSSSEFNGVFSSWRTKVNQYAPVQPLLPGGHTGDVADWTLGQLLTNLKPSQLWSMLAALFALIAAAFTLGTKLHGH
ncbi:hypothetical protein [Tunturiibacter gelidoferens]|uniref:Uncharacterized protein n=1 Tax=Tunturiibacter lichenicola TaxID=2051959 RepID=A0A7Y9T3M7_9BACT|nr:hypothetical protein [Edaphobacter lichenicola]NYF52467.1 hypothetical protein [Edaphobacter lichenicola]